MGLGYREIEYTGFGQTQAQRRRRLEAGLDVLTAAFAGEPVGEVRVTPLPDGDRPELWIGALSDVGVERAAQRADGFLCALPQHLSTYDDARRSAGRDAGQMAFVRSQLVADDPERELARIGEHLLYYANQYVAMGTFGDPAAIPPFTEPQQIVDVGLLTPVTPEAAVDDIVALIDGHPVVDVHGWSLYPGEPIDGASARLELLATRVLPAVRGRLGQ